ncbi:glycoside hydrolase family 19 protein [Chitinophagaceae bacterium MMS25-I14]
MLTLTITQVKSATNATDTNASKFLNYIIATCTKYNITTPAAQLCFLAQVGHESGGLYYTEELASGSAYEGRKDLGNTQPGDGVRFKGRGLIQITGRSNYSAVGTALGADFIDNPTLLGGKNVTVCTPDQLKYAAMSAGWFWNKNNLNNYANLIDITKPIDEGTNLDNFKKITQRINGGYNGLQDRISRYKNGVKYFQAIPAP